MTMARKQRQRQQQQFDKFFESFSNCDEMLAATQKGAMSTDRKFTRKVLQQLAEEDEERQRAEQRAQEQEFLRTCDLAGVKRTTSPARKQPLSPPKKSLKERRREEQRAEAVANLLKKKAAVLPWPFDSLLRLQNYDGRWLDPAQVYACLGLPASNYFTTGARSSVGVCCAAFSVWCLLLVFWRRVNFHTLFHFTHH